MIKVVTFNEFKIDQKPVLICLTLYKMTEEENLLSSSDSSIIESYSSILNDGGVFMWLIILTSVILVTTVFYKLLSLKKDNIIPPELLKRVKNFSQSPTKDGSVELHDTLMKSDSVLSDLCVTAIEKQESNIVEVEKAVEVKARESIVKINSGLAIIEVVIIISPLLGLLGTASGLVGVFSGLTAEGTDHTALAKGIAEALYTTIAGLAVAVPAVIAQSHFVRKIETMSAELELTMSKFISALVK